MEIRSAPYYAETNRTATNRISRWWRTLRALPNDRTKPQVAGVLCAFICLYYNAPSISNFSRISFHILFFTTTSKGKVHAITGHEGPQGEERHHCTLSVTLALDGSGWSTARPGRFTPGKETRYPLYRSLGGPQGRFGRMRKISPPTGIQSLDSPVRSESLHRRSNPGPHPLPVVWNDSDQ